MTARVSMLLKSFALHDMLPLIFCKKRKTCDSAHEQTCLSKRHYRFAPTTSGRRSGYGYFTPPHIIARKRCQILYTVVEFM